MKYLNLLFPTSKEIELAKSARTQSNKYINNIIVDNLTAPEYLSMLLQLSPFLEERFSANISFYNADLINGTRFDKLKRKFHWSMRLLKYAGLHEVKFSNFISRRQVSEAKELIGLEFDRIQQKDDVLSIKFQGILIGDLIYDSYLRKNNVPTIDLNDKKLKKIISDAILFCYQIKNYLKEQQPVAVVLSHAVYVQYGILARFACSENIPVIMFDNWTVGPVVKLSKNHYLQTANHSEYRKDFINNGFGAKERSVSKLMLEKRLEGEIDDGLAYMRESAFKRVNNENNELIKLKQEKNIVVIMGHCFFDSPHIYLNSVFPDFYEWLKHTIQVIESCDLDQTFYIKPHPNGLPGNIAIIKQLISRSKKVKILDPTISNADLLECHLSAVITVYGTAIHEFSYKNVPVIACGDNPHSNYEFYFLAKTIAEYDDFLKNISVLEVTKDKNSILEFFYMHYLASKRHNRMESNDIWKLNALGKLSRNDIFETRLADNPPLSNYKIISDFLNEF